MNFFEELQQETIKEREALYSLPVILDGMKGNISLDTYIAYLTQSYHHVKNTLPLLLLMASRLPKEKEWVRRILVEYISEETGHDDWILGDIKNAGGNSEVAKKSKPSLPVELMNAFNYDYINRLNPMGYFGMIFVLENASTALATQASDAIKKALGLGNECFSYLDSHGALDIEHVEFIGKTLAQITDPQDQADIIHASKVIYQLFADAFLTLPHTYAKKAA